MNSFSRQRPLRSAVCLAALALACLATAGGCVGHIQRTVVADQRVALPSGRFVGPVQIAVPQKIDDPMHAYEILVEVTSACSPRLRVSFPDGETRHVGARNARWQELLALRAEGEAVPEEAAPGTGEGAPGPGEAAAPGAGDAAPGMGDTAPDTEGGPPPKGHWQQVQQGSWPGQLEFLSQRSALCARTRTYRTRYATGLDETGHITLWGDVPQELAGASVHVRIVEAVEVDAIAERKQDALDREREAQARARRAERRARKRQIRLAAHARRKKSKPIPPRPRPKVEHPGQPEVPAQWVSGSWEYAPGRGKWVWVSGYWAIPKTVPADKIEDRGAPPVVGCSWKRGYWAWVRDAGRWEWTPGHWLAPPPKEEERGEPPVPESPWVSGYWVSAGASFRWIPGYWGKPKPRRETIPPPPRPGATWHAGMWLKLAGTWTWSPGFYDEDRPPPPPKKSEQPGTPPAPGAVWLAGFWRWQAAGGRYQWVAGHWELPPGEGYVWVPDPPDPAAHAVIGGHWTLRVDVGGAARGGRR